MTRLAPAVRSIAALSRAVNLPVHSIPMSTPSCLYGNSAGSLIAVTLILYPPTTIMSPSTTTSWGKRPCTVSKRSRCALVSTGPRSLIETTSTSLRPDSTIARNTSRPMRPKPLIATFVAIVNSPLAGSEMRRRRRTYRGTTACLKAPATCAVLSPKSISLKSTGYQPKVYWLNDECDNSPDPSGSTAEPVRGHLRDRIRRDAEVLVDRLIGPALAEALHADERAVADDRVPAKAHRGLDRDLDPRRADHRAAIVLRLIEERVHAGHGDDPGRNAPPLQESLRRDGERNLRPRREDRHNRGALGGRNLVGALLAKVLGDMRPPQRGQVLAGQSEDRGRVRLFERRLPALDRLDAVGGAPEVEIGHRPERRQMLDRLVGRSVLAEPDRIVGEDVHDPDLHQRREPERRPAIVGEDEEGGTRGNDPSMHRHAVAGRRHAMLADAPVDVAAGEILGGDLRSRCDLGVVRRRQVGRTGHEFGQGGRNHVERRLTRLAGRDLRRVGGKLLLVGVDDAGKALGQIAPDAPLEFGPHLRGERGEPRPPGLVLRLAARPDLPPSGENVVRHDERLVAPVEVLAR